MLLLPRNIASKLKNNQNKNKINGKYFFPQQGKKLISFTWKILEFFVPPKKRLSKKNDRVEISINVRIVVSKNI